MTVAVPAGWSSAFSTEDHPLGQERQLSSGRYSVCLHGPRTEGIQLDLERIEQTPVCPCRPSGAMLLSFRSIFIYTAMRFFPAEPDIATVFNRIADGDIDLQPDFQRGEVWPIKKQQRLIDTILRGWVVPPILLVSAGNGHRQQVLDGQQRLASIRDFKLNKFSIDGGIEPADSFIESMHGLRYHSLPPEVAKSFDRTTLRIYEITNYAPEEPAEIFFRLNQPTALTSAEKRNAFFGPVRDQIRRLVEEFEAIESVPPHTLGFTNTRMAYDDILARFACTLEIGTLRKKLSATTVNEMYRRTRPLDEDVIWRLRNSLKFALGSMRRATSLSGYSNFSPRLNKATFFSWLLFFARLDATGDPDLVAKFFIHFEGVRSGLFVRGQYQENAEIALTMEHSTVPLLLVYTDRATSRVADVTSVLLRDFILWVCWYEFSQGRSAGCFDPAYKYIEGYKKIVRNCPEEVPEVEALKFIDEISWGANF